MKIFIYAIVIMLTFAVKGCTQTFDMNTTFTWTASGDDSSTGTVDHNVIWYGTDSADVANMTGSAIELPVIQQPLVAGSAEIYVVVLPNISSEVYYYFTMRAFDNNNNMSTQGNIHKRLSPDLVPPNAILFLDVSF